MRMSGLGTGGARGGHRSLGRGMSGAGASACEMPPKPRHVANVEQEAGKRKSRSPRVSLACCSVLPCAHPITKAAMNKCAAAKGAMTPVSAIAALLRGHGHGGGLGGALIDCFVSCNVKLTLRRRLKGRQTCRLGAPPPGVHSMRACPDLANHMCLTGPGRQQGTKCHLSLQHAA